MKTRNKLSLRNLTVKSFVTNVKEKELIRKSLGEKALKTIEGGKLEIDGDITFGWGAPN